LFRAVIEPVTMYFVAAAVKIACSSATSS
jgi:hypothetical protein